MQTRLTHDPHRYLQPRLRPAGVVFFLDVNEQVIWCIILIKLSIFIEPTFWQAVRSVAGKHPVLDKRGGVLFLLLQIHQQIVVGRLPLLVLLALGVLRLYLTKQPIHLKVA